MADLQPVLQMGTLVTVDDFDPLVSYSNYADWTTPDPSQNPTWFNATEDVTGSPWHQATYHQTSVVGTKATFNFTADNIAIYGAGTDYTITIDPSSEQPYTETFTSRNESGRNALYSSDQLTYSPHTIEITNEGESLLLDVIMTVLDLGAEGATLTNATLDDRDGNITFSGDWTQQTGPNFYEQTSTYTQGAGNAFEFKFEGSAVYLYGDQVNDHGPYTISIDSVPQAALNDRSGCGGGYAKECEKLFGLKFFAGNLGEGEHTLRFENGGPTEGDRTFFDFDRLIVTTPSEFSSQSIESNSSCPFVTCEGSGNATASGTGTSPSSTAPSGSSTVSSSASTSPNAAAGTYPGQALLCFTLGAWLLKKFL